MMTGKMKAQLLLSWLGHSGQSILERLSSTSAQQLTTGIDNLPPIDSDEKRALIREIQSSMQGMSTHSNEADPFATPVQLNSFDEEMLPQTQPVEEAAVEKDAAEPVAVPSSATSDYAEIGAQLAKQRPQIIAFILSRLDETMRESVQRHIPSEILAQAQSKSLDIVPMSEKVYQRIYNSVFKNLN